MNTSVIKIAFSAIVIFAVIFASMPNSSAKFGMMDSGTTNINTNCEYNEKYQMVINAHNISVLLQDAQQQIFQLKKNNIDTKAIEGILSDANSYALAELRSSQINCEKINNAFQAALKAWEMTRTASGSYYINIVNSEIYNATSIGADTKPAVAKLEEAKRALSEGDYNNASLFASDAYILALTSNMGFVSIKDLISSKTINVHKSIYDGYTVETTGYDGHTVETTGLIRNIKTSGASYNFVIDDGNGVISVAYSGGLGDIKEGDSVSVKGVYNSQNINAESVTKGNGLVGGIGSNVKAPGFEGILAISIIGALWLRRKL